MQIVTVHTKYPGFHKVPMLYQDISIVTISIPIIILIGIDLISYITSKSKP